MCLLFCIVYFISYFMLNIMIQISSQQGAKSRPRYIYSLFCISGTSWDTIMKFIQGVVVMHGFKPKKLQAVDYSRA